MQDTRLRLSVLHDDDGSFTDYSDKAVDFSRDTFQIPVFDSADDYLYVGYSKPFHAAYLEASTANTTANTLAMEYYNGTTWVALEDSRDLTLGMTRSGWLVWTKPDDWSETEVNSTAKFWIRLRPSATHTTSTYSGLNLVFADDYDLQTEFPSVLATGFLPTGEVSHIKTHVAVRNQLIQDLRTMGYIKLDSAGGWKNLTPWDLHDIDEVKQAAVWLALAKIFFNYSDAPDDNWAAKSKAYEQKYHNVMKLIKVSFDANDDGEVDAVEKLTVTVSRMRR